MPRQRSRKREKKFVPQGQAFISATFNNTLVTVTDPQGNVISQSSAGAEDLKALENLQHSLLKKQEKLQLKTQ